MKQWNDQVSNQKHQLSCCCCCYCSSFNPTSSKHETFSTNSDLESSLSSQQHFNALSLAFFSLLNHFHEQAPIPNYFFLLNQLIAIIQSCRFKLYFILILLWTQGLSLSSHPDPLSINSVFNFKDSSTTNSLREQCPSPEIEH